MYVVGCIGAPFLMELLNVHLSTFCRGNSG